jgi:DNA polymerase III epsilon subunit-like protein
MNSNICDENDSIKVGSNTSTSIDLGTNEPVMSGSKAPVLVGSNEPVKKEPVKRARQVKREPVIKSPVFMGSKEPFGLGAKAPVMSGSKEPLVGAKAPVLVGAKAPVRKDLNIPKFHRRVMVFDTETTGLMPKHKPGTPYPPTEAYPHIMQLSWIVYNVATNEIEETVDEYVSIPKSVEISTDSIRIHGITREISEQKGKPIIPLLAKFFASYMKCDCIVAHNLQFDGELVRKEMWRNRDELKRKITTPDRVNMMCGIFTKKFNAAYHIDTFCTMMNTIQLCGIDFAANPIVEETQIESPIVKPEPINNARKKFPRLNELYSKLFDSAELPEDLHNSIIDVLVCLRCFLKVRGVKEMTEDNFQYLINTHSRPTPTSQ